MAIEQFGESLLSDIRSRRAKEEKRLRKQEEKQALLSLGVGVLGKIGNKVLEDKMSNFLMNENILKENAQFKAATKVGDYWATQYNEVQKSGLGAQEYYYNTMRPVFEEQAKANIDFGDVGDVGQYDSLIQEEVRNLAKQRADTLTEAMKRVNELGTTEDYKARVGLIAKDTRPTDLLDLGFRKAKNLFTGKTQAEIDAEAIDRIQNSPEALAADELLAFKERYQETNNLVMSYDYAKLQGKIDERKAQKGTKPNVRIKEETETKIVDGKLISTIKVTESYREVAEGRDAVIKTYEKPNPDIAGETIGSATVVDLKSVEDPKKLEQIDLKSRITQFNFGKDAQSKLVPTAYASFVKEVQDTQNVLISNIKSLEDYNNVSKIYAKYIRDPANLVDPTIAAYQQKVFSGFMQNGLDMQMLFYNLSKDPSKRNQYMDNILNGMSTATEMGNYLRTPLKPAGM